MLSSGGAANGAAPTTHQTCSTRALHCCRTVFIIFFLPETKASATRHAACCTAHMCAAMHAVCCYACCVHVPLRLRCACLSLSVIPAALRLAPLVTLAHACPHTPPALQVRHARLPWQGTCRWKSMPCHASAFSLQGVPVERIHVKFAKHWFWGKWMGPAAAEVRAPAMPAAQALAAQGQCCLSMGCCDCPRMTVVRAAGHLPLHRKLLALQAQILQHTHPICRSSSATRRAPPPARPHSWRRLPTRRRRWCTRRPRCRLWCRTCEHSRDRCRGAAAEGDGTQLASSGVSQLAQDAECSLLACKCFFAVKPPCWAPLSRRSCTVQPKWVFNALLRCPRRRHYATPQTQPPQSQPQDHLRDTCINQTQFLACLLLSFH